jgi:hypothetical protein
MINLQFESTLLSEFKQMLTIVFVEHNILIKFQSTNDKYGVFHNLGAQ